MSGRACNRLLSWLAPVLSGLLLYGAFPPLDWGWLAWAALVPLLLSIRRLPPLAAAARGYLFALVFYALLLSWIGLFGWQPWAALVTVQALSGAVFAALASPLLRRGGWPAALGAPGLWVALEWIRTRGTLAFLWEPLGASQHALLVPLQTASVGGLWALSWLVASGNCVLAEILAAASAAAANDASEVPAEELPDTEVPVSGAGGQPSSGRKAPDRFPASTARQSPQEAVGVPTARKSAAGPREPAGRMADAERPAAGPAGAGEVRGRIGSVVAAGRRNAIALLILAAAWGFGAARLLDAQTPPGRSLLVGLAQGNENRLQQSGEYIDPRAEFRRYARLTEDLARRGARLVVWPETALPEFLGSHPQERAALASLAQRTGAAMLVGAFDFDAQGRAVNELLPVGANGAFGPAYAKQQLVPFGEWVPFRRWLPDLSGFGVPAQDLGRGHGPGVMDLAGVRVGGLICFESTLPDLARDRVRSGAQLLAVATNDAWFQHSGAAAQHEASCALRAVETDRPVVRSATTGITAAFDCRGRELGSLPSFQVGSLLVHVSPQSGRTLFVRFGSWVVWAGLVLACFGYRTVVCERRRQFPVSDEGKRPCRPARTGDRS